MAEGGSESPCDETDATTSLHFEQTRIQLERQVSRDDVGEQATVLLQHFIVERFQQDGFADAPGLDDLRAGLAVPSEQEVVWSEVGVMLRSIGDTLDRDRELQRMISSVPVDSPIEAIIAVAHVIFGDGDITWGRIVGLFYFAYRMCARAIETIMDKSFPSWINKLIKEVVKFLVIKFAHWIVNKGGWLAIREYMGSPTWIWGTLMTLSASCLIFSFYKLSR
ncbi:apoptosis regulator BAX [Strongylocentrotus purpuratus]|uniref:Bcl-2 Bcl-2 homology region 1-3 domain-containing protein n=1 Tax=Strongylocentrotus purpuratus TaxID=7668 RepID=A0A7M7P7I3_STRPU|nr:apoptosis regulator BAX [Strongylocentrotus purpuratus]XP_030844984.1 apoptosis regulator BAX [Strongylocentrotus purpuratus]